MTDASLPVCSKASSCLCVPSIPCDNIEIGCTRTSAGKYATNCSAIDTKFRNTLNKPKLSPQF